MKISPGYSNTQNTNLVCKLRKAFYGLKESSRDWFGRFSQVMKKSSYSRSNGDHSFFYKYSDKDKLTFISNIC